MKYTERYEHILDKFLPNIVLPYIGAVERGEKNLTMSTLLTLSKLRFTPQKNETPNPGPRFPSPYKRHRGD